MALLCYFHFYNKERLHETLGLGYQTFGQQYKDKEKPEQAFPLNLNQAFFS